MNINPLLRAQRGPKLSFFAAVAGMLGIAGPAHSLPRLAPAELVSPLPLFPRTGTFGVPRWSDRRSYLSSRRDARRRRNAAKRGGAR